MSNVLAVSHQQTIINPVRQNWSHRRIARELGINRRTAQRYAGKVSKRATNSTAGNVPGRRSHCEGFDLAIREGVAAGLTAQRIFQDLRSDHIALGDRPFIFPTQII
jgi:transposase